MVPMLDVTGTKELHGRQSDKATDDFSYSTFNEFAKKQSWPVTDQRDLVNFFTVEENWLYDRAQTFYNNYLRTGNADMLREANRASNHYAQNVYGPESCPTSSSPFCVGCFKLKNTNPNASFQDTKYSYSENLLSNYLLNGDPSVLKTIGYVSWVQEFQTDLAGDGLHRAAPRLRPARPRDRLRADRQHPRAGSAPRRDRGDAPAADLAPAGNAPNGCFNYPPEGKALTFSPWMSSLLTWSLVRAYHATGNTKVPPALADFGKCEVERGIDVVRAGQPAPEGMNVGELLLRSTSPPASAPSATTDGKDEEEVLERVRARPRRRRPGRPRRLLLYQPGPEGPA